MIQKCVTSRAFTSGTSIPQMVELCARAGFDGIELVLDERGELNLDAQREDFETALHQFRAAGIRVAALTSSLYGDYHFASPNESSRRAAEEITRGLIERAAWLCAPIVRVRAAVVGPVEPNKAFVSYENALSGAFEGLLDVIEEAEKRGVTIAIRAASGHFLLSPIETRSFIDRLNTSAVGVALNVHHVAQYGFPQDWLRCLGYRVECVVLGRIRAAGRDDQKNPWIAIHGRAAPRLRSPIDTAEVIRALSEIRYEGPLIYEGTGNLQEIAEVLEPFTSCA